jgi:hypothetical protein
MSQEERVQQMASRVREEKARHAEKIREDELDARILRELIEARDQTVRELDGR